MLQNKTILVVEDEPSILKNICTILQISGYNCIQANDGVQALEQLKFQHPDLIICDVMMPKMDGFEVLQHVLEDNETQNIPFCFLSARADVVDIDNGLSTGAKAYITKPFLAKDLIHTAQRLLVS